MLYSSASLKYLDQYSEPDRISRNVPKFNRNDISMHPSKDKTSLDIEIDTQSFRPQSFTSGIHDHFGPCQSLFFVPVVHTK